MEHLPTAGHHADEYIQLIQNITLEIDRQAAIAEASGSDERVFQREPFRNIIIAAQLDPLPVDNCFDFAWCIDWNSSEESFNEQLWHFTTDILSGYYTLAANYPNGIIDTRLS